MNQSAENIDSVAMMRSWGCSIALHVTLWGLGLWLISQQAIVPPSLFQWEVSLASPSRESSSDIPSSDASSQIDNQTRSAVTRSVRRSAAAAPSIQPEIQAEQAVQEPAQSEAGAASSQSVAAGAVPTPNVADHSTALPLSDMAEPSQTVGESQNAVDDEAQGPPISNGQSVVAAAQRTESSAGPSPEVTGSFATVTHASPFETAPDFGWLMQMLWSRVTELKHYPPEARMNRWEGRVVVRVVIDEQGRLLDAAIATGSGHELLDHAALDVIKGACPLALPRSLGRSQIVLRVPIQYRLDS